MATQMNHKWWEDCNLLNEHSIRSGYARYGDAVRFEKTVHTENGIRVIPVEFDYMLLDKGKIGLSEILHHMDVVLRDLPDYRHNGPTNEQLRKYPALKAAWREYQIIARMTGIDNEIVD